ncbi:hypothetical protein DFP73DRAFT_451150, partial [Morchella snyderi]
VIIGGQSKYQAPSSSNLQALRKGTDLVPFCWKGIHTFLEECTWELYDRIGSAYLDQIDAVVLQRSQEEDLSKHIVGEEITGDQLLALCFNDRIQLDADYEVAYTLRRKRGSCAVVAATKGYIPAQAVAPLILANTRSKLFKLVDIKYSQWQRNAVSTGYLLAWKMAAENPEEYELALCEFRKSGGYNTHYTCLRASGKNGLIYGSSGLLVDPLAGLSEYPLHHAAVHDDASKIESILLEYQAVDSTAVIGDTALHMACMAGAFNAVCALIKHGADPNIKSKRFGTVPLHWLFLFEPAHVHEVATLLAVNKSLLNEVSSPNIQTFHYPFAWPVGTPLEWAVLSNRPEAISALLDLGSSL